MKPVNSGLTPTTIMRLNDGSIEAFDDVTAKEILLHLKEGQPSFRDWSDPQHVYIPIPGAEKKFGKWKRANSAYLGVVELPKSDDKSCSSHGPVFGYSQEGSLSGDGVVQGI